MSGSAVFRMARQSDSSRSATACNGWAIRRFRLIDDVLVGDSKHRAVASADLIQRQYLAQAVDLFRCQASRL